ncbi:MAG: methyltransferase domain-containing protein [Candidatus Hydrothermarchaeota archaeon]
MKSITLDIICCPTCKGCLTFDGQPDGDIISGGILSCENCQRNFPVEEGIVRFLHGEKLVSHGKRFDAIREIYSSFYTPLTNLFFIACGGAKRARHEVLDRLEISSGAKILETGIGTGDNLPFLREYLNGGSFYGVDINQKMLRLCVRNLKKWGLQADLFWADAERLPYKDETFDVVFHLGAINLFFNKKQAIEEMIRVARPGTKIVIADESEKGNRFFKLFVGKQEKVIPPVDLVPGTMLNVRLDTIWKGYGYLIEFRTPPSGKR